MLKRNDVGFWAPEDMIERRCYEVADDIGGYEYVIRDIETFACRGDICNAISLPDSHLPPLGQLPKDQERWEEPLTQLEVDMYCGTAVECIECYSCQVPYVDNIPDTYQCELKTFRAQFLKDSSANLVRNHCSTTLGYSINNMCDQTRFIKKGVSQTPVDDPIEPIEGY